MTEAASTGPEERVCPDCGNHAGDQPFCASCGRNLATVKRLPSRAEWEARQPAIGLSSAVDEPRSDDARPVGDSPAVPTGASKPAGGIGTPVLHWIRQHRLLAGTGAVGIAAAIIVIIAVNAGSGGVDPVAAQHPVALYVAGASNLNPGDASCVLNATVSPGVFRYSCSPTVEGVEFQTMDATYDSHKDINNDPSAVTISNYQTVNIPPGYTYDPSTGHYAPGPGIATP